MKKFKRLLAVVLASTLMSSSFGYLGTTTVYAEEAVAVEDRTGLEEMTEIVVDDSETVVVSDEKYSHADVTSSAYTEYTNDYFYNQLTTTEKSFYNKMFMACQKLLTSSADAYYSSGNYYTDFVSYSGLTCDNAVRVASIMKYNNPQFYFINANYATTVSGDNFALGVYSEFGTGTTRSNATNKLFSVVESYLAKVNAQSSTYAKQRMAHDLICVNTVYDDSLNASANQGVYSVFVNGLSVCAGYSEAFAMLCNAAGIQTVSVTSYAHEWNLILLNGNWYYVDCTWDDGNGEVYDKLYLDCGSNTVFSQDSNGYHTPESDVWTGIYPEVSLTDYIVSGSELSGYVAPTNTSTTTTPTVASQVMYRLYNPNSGEHFYTADSNEKKYLDAIGWNYEGTAWTAPVSSGSPVYRMYNPNAGDHHYTTNAAERDMLRNAGWNYEGIGWYSADSQTTPLYRLYNPNAIAGAHHYTTNAAEKDMLASIGWRYEGLAWYGL